LRSASPKSLAISISIAARCTVHLPSKRCKEPALPSVLKEQLEELATCTQIRTEGHSAASRRSGVKNQVLLDGSTSRKPSALPKSRKWHRKVATVAKVRKLLVAQQQPRGRRWRHRHGRPRHRTVVFPNAELKIFLEASPEVRAERRWKEHEEKANISRSRK